MSTRTTAAAKATADKTTLDVANVVQDATAKVETFVADAQKTVTEQFEKFSKGLEGLTTFGQENVDALVKSSEIAAKAAEGIGTEIGAYSKKAFEDGVAAAQDFAAAKTVTELFEKQTSYAQAAFEGFVSPGHQDERDLRCRCQGHHRPARRPRLRGDRRDEVLQPLISAGTSARSLLLPDAPPPDERFTSALPRRPSPPGFFYARRRTSPRAGRRPPPFPIRRDRIYWVVFGVPDCGAVTSRGTESLKDPRSGRPGVLTRTRAKTERPPLYKVMLLNDDYTPMDFVVHVLERFFGIGSHRPSTS